MAIRDCNRAKESHRTEGGKIMKEFLWGSLMGLVFGFVLFIVGFSITNWQFWLAGTAFSIFVGISYYLMIKPNRTEYS